MQALAQKVGGWWYKLKSWFYKLLGLRMSINLPCDPQAPNLLDKSKITKVILFYPANPYSPYFMCEINGVWHHLAFSEALKNWFDASGIKVSVIQDDLEQVILDLYNSKPTKPNNVDVPVEFEVNIKKSTSDHNYGY